MFNLSKYERLHPLASLRRQTKKPSIPYRYSYGLLFVQLDILRYGIDSRRLPCRNEEYSRQVY